MLTVETQPRIIRLVEIVFIMKDKDQNKQMEKGNLANTDNARNRRKLHHHHHHYHHHHQQQQPSPPQKEMRKHFFMKQNAIQKKKGIFRKQELLGIKIKKIETKISIESFENQVEEISQKVEQKR